MPLDQLIPRGPVFFNKDDNTLPDYTDKYSQKISAYRDSIRTEAIRSLKNSPEYPNVAKYLEYLKGNQRDPRLPLYRSKFYVNKMDKSRYDTLALLTDTRPVIDVSSSVDSFKENGELAANVIRAEWTRRRMDLDLVKIADINLLWGTAFSKNQAASPGEMSMLPCGPDQVFPIQPGWDMQTSSAVLYRVWKSLAYFKTKYPMSSDGIERQISSTLNTGSDNYTRPGNIESVTWNSMSPQMRRLVGSTMDGVNADDRQMFGGIELQEIYLEDFSINESMREVVMKDPYLPISMHNWWYIVKPGERLYPRKRLLVFGGKKLLYDGPSPYWHGLYPFSCLRMDPQIDSFYGHSMYRNLVPLQDAINEVGAGILDMQKRILNPTAITTEKAVSKAAWDMFLSGAPGKKLMLAPNVDIKQAFTYAPNPEIPSWVMQMLTEWYDPEFDKMAGTMDTVALLQKKQVPGGDTIEQMKDSLQTANRLRERYLEAYLTDVGTQAVSNVFQFYTKSQRLKLLGDDGLTWSDFDYKPENAVPATEKKETFWKNFAMTITPGSLHGGAHDRNKQIAIALWNSKAIDLKSLHEKLEMFDPDQIVERMMEQAKIQAELEGQAKQQGEVPRLGREQRNGSQPI